MNNRSMAVGLFVLSRLCAEPVLASFVDVAGDVGLTGELATWGAQAIDIDDDGDVDLVVSNHFFDVTIYTNAGDGTFVTDGIQQIVGDIEDRHGFLWADLDGDFDLDVVCSHGGGGGCGCADNGNELWANDGGGMFTEQLGAGGMDDPTGRGRAFSAADVDDDGDLDLFHGQAPLTGVPDRLYRNDGALTFTDVAGAWGLASEDGTGGAAFADFDDDGDDDLLVGGEEFSRPTTLWRNEGTSFSDATTLLGPAVPVISSADWGDYDNDGDVDLAVCEGSDAITDAAGVAMGTDFWFFAHHRLSDDGEDVFTLDAGSDSPVAIIQWSGTTALDRIFLGPAGDHPSDPTFLLTDAYVGAPTFAPGVDEGVYVWRETPGGIWRIHVSAPPGTFGNYSGWIYTSGVTATTTAQLETPTILPGTARVYRNDGTGFAEVTASLGISASTNPRAVTWVDFDNDGDLDLHQVNKGTTQTGNESDVLWRNDGVLFSALGDVPGDPGHLSDGGVWADFDRDGDLDLYLQEGAGPAFFANLAAPILYRNDLSSGHWLGVSLTPPPSGDSIVGAQVTVQAGGISVHRRVSANSWRGFQPPLTLHFGLGSETTVDEVAVVWADGTTSSFGPFVADQFVTLTDPTFAPETTTTAVSVGLATPQPARKRQTISLALAREAQLLVDVYDIRGRRIRQLADTRFSAGTHVLVWDGRDDDGRAVASGIYFLRARGDLAFERKLVRLR